MIKSLIIATTLVFVALGTNAQSAVKVDLLKNEFVKGDTLFFQVALEEDEKLEVAFFCDTKMVFHQNTKMKKGIKKFSIPITDDCTSGEYYVLVTGNEIHEQRAVYIR
jgi:hypothetical protein